ncbi:MAG: hypothetical protein DRP30_07465 [Thermotoga sp.]|nr:MAG: hypothetical protein DRP30_07465 [Thermotoga sp.]
MKNDVVYLKHVRDAMKKVMKYLENKNKEEFIKNEILQDAVIRQLEIMGEAVKNLSLRIILDNPQIPWKGMVGLRDVLIHGYDKVNLEIIWKIAREDVPKTFKKIEDLIATFENEE